jgi:transposase-like protein
MDPRKGYKMDKRRVFTPELKLQVVLDVLSGRKSNAEVCREHSLAPAVVTAWKEQFSTRAPGIFAGRQSESHEQAHIAELERLVGRQALEIEVLKKASSILTSLSRRNGR